MLGQSFALPAHGRAVADSRASIGGLGGLLLWAATLLPFYTFDAHATDPACDPGSFNFPVPGEITVSGPGVADVRFRGEHYQRVPIISPESIPNATLFYRAFNNGQKRSEFIDEVALFKMGKKRLFLEQPDFSG